MGKGKTYNLTDCGYPAFSALTRSQLASLFLKFLFKDLDGSSKQVEEGGAGFASYQCSKGLCPSKGLKCCAIPPPHYHHSPPSKIQGEKQTLSLFGHRHSQRENPAKDAVGTKRKTERKGEGPNPPTPAAQQQTTTTANKQVQ